MRKPKKPRAVNYELIAEFDGKVRREPYILLEKVRKDWHQETSEARIVLAWRKKLKQDKDGHLVLGKCVKASDLHKQLAPYDFVILLNREIWMDMDFTKERKIALLDHEMCHAAPSLSKHLETQRDELGRIVWRVRKHDIEEFNDVVKRHGCYKKDLERFAETLLKKRGMPLLAKMEENDKPPAGLTH